MWGSLFYVLLIILTIVTTVLCILTYVQNRNCTPQDDSSVDSEATQQEGAAIELQISQRNSTSSRAASLLTADCNDCCLNDLVPGLSNSFFSIENPSRTNFTQIEVTQDRANLQYSSDQIRVEGSDDGDTWELLGVYVLNKTTNKTAIQFVKPQCFRFVRVRSEDEDRDDTGYWKLCKLNLV